MSGEQDPKALRALAHPLRWKLIDLLAEEGSATATRCSQVLGESVASCSYHLNILAKYGYVEQAGGGAGREKPWRLTSTEQNWSGAGEEGEAALAAQAVNEVFIDHEAGRLKANARAHDRAPLAWQRATAMRGLTTVLTIEELREITAQLEVIVSRYADRLDDASRRPVDGRWVRLFFAASLIPPRPGQE
jgi:predicted ArsR family transcriptional regulator